MTTPRTAWAPTAVYVAGVPVKEVPIPHKPLKGKGQTKYDQQFEKMLQHKTAIEIHEDNFEAMRRALMRFREYRNLKGKLTIRQHMNSETRMVTLWFEMKDEMQ